ncbi:1-acyl-sn-glycerol-3-phosphate acyltransferase [Sphingomonas zeicaulis]|uniref:lysophospholipid acyltransferase family protein n=1 Tax=Sphingomonas zeicaulis TaxID=1632740 RepID=UPI003D1B7E5E
MASRSIGRADPLGWLRFAVRVAALLILLILHVPLHFLWRLLRQPSPWPRHFLACVAWVAGARVHVVGAPVAHDVFYVANHLGWIDIPVIAGASGAAFVAQDGIARAPVVGWLSSLNNTIFVSRSDRLGVAEQIEALRVAVSVHQPVTIFPEGTTTDGSFLLPFKPALFAAMAPPPRPMLVQPLLLDYGAAGSDIAWIGEEKGDANAIRVLQRKGCFKVTLHFLEPYDPAALDGRKAVSAEARARISSALAASKAASRSV